MNRKATLAMAAIVAALGLVGALAIETLILPLQQQQAEARGCESSFPHSSGGAVGFNAIQGRCFGHYLVVHLENIDLQIYM
jgi:hypothetical protein